MTSTSLCPSFRRSLYQRLDNSAEARGLRHTARNSVLMGVLSALVCPNWGFQVMDMPKSLMKGMPAPFHIMKWICGLMSSAGYGAVPRAAC